MKLEPDKLDVIGGQSDLKKSGTMSPQAIYIRIFKHKWNSLLYLIKITGMTDATGVSNRNLINAWGKLNMC